MKRKVKKFNGEDGSRVYDKEDEGILGGKIKYREDSEGRKYTAAPSNPMMRNSGEQRYYSVGDVKNKLSSLFGGKKEDEPKKSTTMPSGYEKLDATEGNARVRQIGDYIKKSEPKAEEPAKPTGTTFLREEADIEEKPAKKVVAKKAAPKASQDSGFPKDTKSTRMPSGYDKLDPRSPEEKGIPKKIRSTADIRAGRAASDEESKVSIPKNTITKERQEAADKAYYAGWKKKPVRSTADIRAGRQVESMKKGGSVRKSASARADGCAIRGKTRA